MNKRNKDFDVFNVVYEPSKNGELSKLTAHSNNDSKIIFTKSFYGKKADRLYDKLTKP